MGPFLDALPNEIAQLIADFLPTSSLIAMKLTNRQIFLQLPSPTSSCGRYAPRCEMKSIRRYLSERKHTLGGRRKCILCDGLMPVAFFHHAGKPICKWHDGWFSKRISSNGDPSTADMAWSKQMGHGKAVLRVLCAHCKIVRGWDAANCACEADGGCDNCGVWLVDCYFRSLDPSINGL